MYRQLTRVFSIALLAASASAAQRQRVARGAIDGIVTDSSLGPLSGAMISLLGTSVSATTNEAGRFRIVSLPIGQYVVFVRRIGYATSSTSFHLSEGDTLRPSFALQRLPLPAEMDTVRTIGAWLPGRLAEFEERRRHSIGGHFITQAEIERRNPVYLADILRGIPSVEIREGPFGPAMAISKRDLGDLRRPLCPFQIFVDGMIFSEQGDVGQIPSPKEIAAVEIYSGPATLPLQYKRHDSGCGIILIWTRSGK